MTDSTYAGFFAVSVRNELREAFIDASIKEAESVIGAEAGALQFQILADAEDPNRFYFFEVYRDEAAAGHHMETEVFKAWHKTVGPMLEGDVEILATMRTVFPSKAGRK